MEESWAHLEATGLATISGYSGMKTGLELRSGMPIGILFTRHDSVGWKEVGLHGCIC